MPPQGFDLDFFRYYEHLSLYLREDDDHHTKFLYAHWGSFHGELAEVLVRLQAREVNAYVGLAMGRVRGGFYHTLTHTHLENQYPYPYLYPYPPGIAGFIRVHIDKKNLTLFISIFN